MFTEEAKKEVEKAIAAEVINAESYSTAYASEHEAYAVIKEELEETHEVLEQACKQLQYFWEKLKSGHFSEEDRKYNIVHIHQYAQNTALEAIQVCACCEKLLKNKK